MKYPGCVMEFIHARNQDILRAYRKIVASTPYIIRADVLRRVADSPASRFWVSEERASFVVKAMLAGKPLLGMRETKREMFTEIFRRFLIERRLRPSASVPELISHVIYQPAPKFYFTPGTIGEFVHHAQREERARKVLSRNGDTQK